MSITVNTNMSSIIAQCSLYKATNKMNTALERLSTGLRINSAKDDAAGSAISTKLEYKMSSYNVAKDNAQMGQSMLDTANGTLTQINSMLQRIRDLSEQASNGTYGDDERKAMQAEIDGLTAEIKRIKETTEFNGKKLFGEEVSQIKDTHPSLATVSSVSINDIRRGKEFKISSADDLKVLSEFVKKGNDTTGKIFYLANDIDMSNIDDFTPIGQGGSRSFKGTFDGQGCTISNLTIDNGTSSALFGSTVDATIKDVNLDNVNIETKYNGAALVKTMSGGTVDNCHATNVTISSSYKTTSYDSYGSSGGLIATCNKGNISNSSVSLKNISAPFIGGFAGCLTNGATVENCQVKGSVQTAAGVTGYAGGFVLFVKDATITNCSANMQILGNLYTSDNYSQVAGFVYELSNGAIIKNSTCSGSLENAKCGAGFIGNANYQQNKNIKLENCSTSVKISNMVKGASIYTFSAGRLVDSNVTNCITTSEVDNNRSAYVMNSLGSNSEIDLKYKYDKTTTGRKIYPVDSGKGSDGIVCDPTVEEFADPYKHNPKKAPKIWSAEQKTNLQVGIGSDSNSIITIDTGFALGDFSVSVLDEKDARESINRIDTLMSQVTNKLTEIGSVQNRLQSVMEFQEVQRNALTSANSLIKDADIAKESAKYVKNQILQNVTATLLATANQNPSIALQLI